MQGRIYWKSASGVIGHGSEIIPFSDAKVIMDRMDIYFPELKHWFIVSR